MRYYDAISSSYNRLYGVEQGKKWGFVKERVRVCGRVLDLGCGTGFLLRELNAVGLDLSKAMLLRASGKRFCGDAHSLPFRDNVFDWVVSLSLLQDVPDPERVVREARRVGGNLVFSVLKKNWSKERLARLGFEKIWEEKKDWIGFTRARPSSPSSKR